MKPGDPIWYRCSSQRSPHGDVPGHFVRASANRFVLQVERNGKAERVSVAPGKVRVRKP